MLKIIKFLKPYKGATIASLLLSLFNHGMQLILPALMSVMINTGIAQGNMDYVKTIGVLMTVLSAVAITSAIAGSYYSSKVSACFGMSLRRAVFVKVESLSQCDIDKIGTPSLITRTTNDIRQIQDMLLMMIRIIISAPIVMVGGAVMAFALNKRLSTIIFIAIPIIVGIALLVAKKVLPLFDKIQKKTDRLNLILREKLSGIRVIRAFNRSEFEDEKFRAANFDLTSMLLKVDRTFALLMPLATMLLYSAVAILIWMGAKQIDALDATVDYVQISHTVGDLQAFMVYMLMIVFAVTMAASLFVMLPRAQISAKRINEVLELRPMIKESEHPAVPAEHRKSELVFENVSFSYPGADSPILSRISFKTMPGETTAIIGSTGSGKSTLVNLIPRFYDVTGGRILVDGLDIRNMSTKTLHQKIGFIPQTAFLFSGTIADNLRFGKPDATEEEMWRALEIAQAADFVRAMPDGLESELSQNGKNLSGGQKQRLAIARVLIRQSEIYVFDDSFSALDFSTDAKLRRALKENMKDIAKIIVAQRVGTIIDADRIIVLDEGKIAGIGTHKELLDTCTVYREIAQSQLSKEDLA
ncbi:MAG: ABC transporter ATP-binding protein [Clostridia bacterium]|nr:ABC transporter ATP-binding protein [Clostridia bacterium]